MKNLCLLLLSFIFLQSCAPRLPFTSEVRQQYKLTEDELKQLQFYISHDIILTKNAETVSSKTTEDGTLKIRKGQSTDQVIIKAGTPGIVEKVIDKNRIAVSFEQGKYLVFGDPDGNRGNYTFLAANWRSNRGVLKYGEEEMYANRGAANTFIKFKMSKLNKIQKKTRVAKGRKL